MPPRKQAVRALSGMGEGEPISVPNRMATLSDAENAKIVSICTVALSVHSPVCKKHSPKDGREEAGATRTGRGIGLLTVLTKNRAHEQNSKVLVQPELCKCLARTPRSNKIEMARKSTFQMGP
eukprot:1160766-Pelagomonas_calceolata.AAC.4